MTDNERLLAAFGSREKAEAWLQKPLAILDGLTPSEAMKTEPGREVVRQLLANLKWGNAL